MSDSDFPTPEGEADQTPEEPEEPEPLDHALLEPVIDQGVLSDPLAVAGLREAWHSMFTVHSRVLAELTEKLVPTGDTSVRRADSGHRPRNMFEDLGSFPQLGRATGHIGEGWEGLPPGSPPPSAQDSEINPESHGPDDNQHRPGPVAQWLPGREWKRTRNAQKAVQAALAHLLETQQAITGIASPPPHPAPPETRAQRDDPDRG